jgi:DNA invertase Pin-like site-specific DNA recombinase
LAVASFIQFTASPASRRPYPRDPHALGGCGKLFEEKISGAARQRPALERLLQELRADDILVVTRLDRLARSTAELLRIAEIIAEKNAGLQSLEEPWGNRGKIPGIAADQAGRIFALT